MINELGRLGIDVVLTEYEILLCRRVCSSFVCHHHRVDLISLSLPSEAVDRLQSKYSARHFVKVSGI